MNPLIAKERRITKRGSNFSDNFNDFQICLRVTFAKPCGIAKFPMRNPPTKTTIKSSGKMKRMHFFTSWGVEQGRHAT